MLSFCPWPQSKGQDFPQKGDDNTCAAPLIRRSNGSITENARLAGGAAKQCAPFRFAQRENGAKEEKSEKG